MTFPSDSSPMKKVIFYCHGYGTSSNTDKVRRIKDMGHDVIAHDIELDPSVSLPYLDKIFMDWCNDFFNAENVDICFVGTSLGDWYANKLGHSYGAQTALINPSLDPARSLRKYGVSDDILEEYAALGPMTFTEQDTVIIAENDEILNFPNEPIWCHPARLLKYPSAGHRFNGPELEDAIRRIFGG